MGILMSANDGVMRDDIARKMTSVTRLCRFRLVMHYATL